MRVRAAALGALLLCATAAPRAVHAQSDPDAEAARAFEAAERAFAANDYEAALRGFRAAQALERHDATLFNVAVCLERLGRFKEALAAYSEAARSEQLAASERQRAEELGRQMRSRLAVVSITGEPQGAQVLVEGREECRLPCTLELDPGSHRLAARAGGEEWARTLELERGARLPVAVDLRPRTAPGPAPDRRPPQARSSGPTWLTWVGAGTFAVGAAGFTYFGLRARGLNDEYEAHPSRDTFDSGKRHQLLANVSIGVAAAGAVAVALDLFVLGKPAASPRTRAAR